jgi:CMP-N-acetylneuraminic acid synthetase
MNEILIYDTEQFPADFYLQTHSTNPLLKAETISDAIHAFNNNYPNLDSLFSVTRWQTRFYDKDGNAVNHDPKELIQTQDLPPMYEENSCIYIFTRENLIAKRHRISNNPLMFEIPRLEAVDIDDESDFQVAHLLKMQDDV